MGGMTIAPRHHHLLNRESHHPKYCPLVDSLEKVRAAEVGEKDEVRNREVRYHQRW